MHQCRWRTSSHSSHSRWHTSSSRSSITTGSNSSTQHRSSSTHRRRWHTRCHRSRRTMDTTSPRPSPPCTLPSRLPPSRCTRWQHHLPTRRQHKRWLSLRPSPTHSLLCRSRRQILWLIRAMWDCKHLLKSGRQLQTRLLLATGVHPVSPSPPRAQPARHLLLFATARSSSKCWHCVSLFCPTTRKTAKWPTPRCCSARAGCNEANV
mmetsp:Transcript_64380/g.104145  ORF Transcript_64380/g.104145 Transcript_64380/m.104145 type:complete len:207 (+) Transcript_64380:921-1541(+)